MEWRAIGAWREFRDAGGVNELGIIRKRTPCHGAACGPFRGGGPRATTSIKAINAPDNAIQIVRAGVFAILL